MNKVGTSSIDSFSWGPVRRHVCGGVLLAWGTRCAVGVGAQLPVGCFGFKSRQLTECCGTKTG